MVINLEHAALKALAELKSMPTEALVTEVLSNAQEPLAVAIREIGYLNEKEFQSKTDSLEAIISKEELSQAIDSLISEKLKHLETKIEALEFLLKLMLISMNQKSTHSKTAAKSFMRSLVNIESLASFSNRLSAERNY
jgi:predicted RecB family endonuclease